MNQNSRNILASNIEKLRKERKMTREGLSLALGFDNSYFSKLEKGNINITVDKLDKIANYFKIKTFELLK